MAIKTVDADEESYSVQTLLRLYEKNGAMQSLFQGETSFLIWDDENPITVEVKVSGSKLVDLLMIQRDQYAAELAGVLSALRKHGVDYDRKVVSASDQIDMLVGRLKH